MKQRVLSAGQPIIINNSSTKGRRYPKMQTEYSQGHQRDSSKGSKSKPRASFLRKGQPWAKGLTKEPEDIMEENLNLKCFINNLQEQLVLQRSKLEVNKRKN
jgi:hypothetical protein